MTDRSNRERIKRLRSTGKTLDEVAELVGVSRRTVARVLAQHGVHQDPESFVGVADEEIEAEWDLAFAADTNEEAA